MNKVNDQERRMSPLQSNSSMKFLSAMLLTLLAAQALAGESCELPNPLVSNKRPRPSREAIEGISSDLTVAEIFRRLGPADSDVGSGVHIFVWYGDNGRMLRLSAADLCGRPLSLQVQKYLSRAYGGSRPSSSAAVTGPPVNADAKLMRTQEEIDAVFEKNFGALYAVYSRAQRDKPSLHGAVEFELTIRASGEVSDCTLVSSEIKDAEFERKLIARLKLFNFGDSKIENARVTKRVVFNPM